MGLFSKKKEKKEPQELPPLKFPEFPKEQTIPPTLDNNFEEFPSETDDIKKAISTSGFPKKKPVEQFPLLIKELPEMPRNEVKGNILFVRIENFKIAKEKINGIKMKIDETEKILEKIDELRKEEEEELTKWNGDLNSIKRRILQIDKRLFE